MRRWRKPNYNRTAQSRRVKAQLEQSAQELEARKLALEEQRHMHEATMAAQDQTIRIARGWLAETAAGRRPMPRRSGQMQDIGAIQARCRTWARCCSNSASSMRNRMKR